MAKPKADPHDEAASMALLAVEAVIDALIGPRLSAKEIATRAAALAVLRGHWRVSGLPVSRLAARLGVSHTALARRIRALPGEMAAHLATMRKHLAAREKRSVHAHQRKPRQRFQRPAKGKRP